MRYIFWKHRLKYASAVLMFFIITVTVYLHLPDVISSQPEYKKHRRLDDGWSIKNSIASAAISSSKSAAFKSLTVLIREYEDFENKLSETVANVERSIGDVKVVIIADSLPYPPVNLSASKSAKIMSLSSDFSKNYSSSCSRQFLKTNLILFLPDGVRINGWSEIRKAASILASDDGVRAVALAIGNKPLRCSASHVNDKEWTISFKGNGSENAENCSLVEGLHALLLTKETLMSLPEPFALPFPHTFYVQATAKDWKVHILKDSNLTIFHEFFKDFHNTWKHKQRQAHNLRQFYRRVGIKREILRSGISNYYGCTKDTARCFGTVINDMPSYLYQGKWTPPCCLHGLREVAAHVIQILEKCKTRYWLEGGSLLGAARHGDIIPWDYDVDVGIYQEDVDKCHQLQQAKLSPYVDDEYYVWEKAAENDFFRVQYSETNHLHIDIFPFYQRNGIMTKNFWFSTHPQDTEFPESFLIPLTRVKFAGIEANAPNNVRQFLEFKFGKNVIENPRYPNQQTPVI